MHDCPGVLRFDRFEIRSELRQVWVGGVVAPIGARAFDLLMLLVEQRDRVVGKDEIFSKVWPGLVVEDNNLSVQISALRRALGAEVITTSVGRGYRFVSPPAGEGAAVVAAAPVGNLPRQRRALFGREAELAQIVDAFRHTACVTLCGIAGVGKTALAGWAGQRLAVEKTPAHGVWLLELADVRDPALLVHAVCERVGIELDGRQDPLAECLAHLQHRELLLIFDNCEHIVAAVAGFVEVLLTRARRVDVLATSQEPLRVTGERVLRLEPLAVPESSTTQGAEAYGAVQLMLERVRASVGSDFEPTAEEFVDMVEICRHLDGIPLALEFAASRVHLLGLAGVRSRLHDRLRLLAGGCSRATPPRHRSLQAALEWSHQLLSPGTQQVLHRLAVFPGSFSLVGARLLLEPRAEADLIEHLDVLVDRSLVTLQGGPYPRYRLLETTRAFALDCLAAATDGVDWQARFAAAMGRLCVIVSRERDSVVMWQEMPNARAALAWALASPAHHECAVTIATYTSVILGAGGAMHEALENLMRVRHLVTDACPSPLAARYWHWLGRLGVEGRLASSLCVAALRRADTMFADLNEPRHRHACQRHLAEAELRAGRLDSAEQHLQAARALETRPPSPADRMRRLRVDALLSGARNEHAAALRQAQSALTLAEAHGIDRYRLLLMADMAWTHVQMGHPDIAVTAMQELLLHLDSGIRLGLVRARAMSGLTAALVAAGRIDEAMRSAGRSVSVLQQANLLRSHCDVFAWVAAAAGDAPTAARLIGASDEFAAHNEVERGRVSALARARAAELVAATLTPDETAHWCAHGASADESELIHLLEHAFRCPPEAARPPR